MLMISRRLGERIVIGDDIEVLVTEIRRRSVRLGVRGGAGKLILRGEVHDAIEAANRAAAEASLDDAQLSALMHEAEQDEADEEAPVAAPHPSPLTRTLKAFAVVTKPSSPKSGETP